MPRAISARTTAGDAVGPEGETPSSTRGSMGAGEGGSESVGRETGNTVAPIVGCLGGTPTAAFSDVIRPDK